MKSKMFKKLMAASLVATMAVSMAGCGKTETDGGASTSAAPSESASQAGSNDASSAEPSAEPSESEPAEDLGSYTIQIDPATGQPYDLGGMEIIIRNWWAPAEAPEPQNEYEEARLEYREWAMETYNFTIKEAPMGDWGSAPQDFVDYVSTGGDDVNYVFTLRDDPAVVSGMAQGLMYDLATLDCLDFSESKFTNNKVHELYASGDKIFAMNVGNSEPRTGMWFNKRLLTEAGIDPESIYDMQANGTWTWDAWTDMMAKVQRDTNNDGVIDVYGMDANYGVAVEQAVYSNASEFVGNEGGKYVYKFEDPATVEALEWINEVNKTYGLVRPADTTWEYYKEAFVNGYCAFCPDQAYMGNPGQPFYETVDEVGFVMFPKGPNATDYTNCWTNNSLVIPACYDADRAWKIAFAFDLFSAPVPDYEDYIDLSAFRNGNFDARGVDETCLDMMSKGMVTYHALIPNLDMGAPFLWLFSQSADVVISEVLESNRDAYKAWIDEANK